MSRANKICGLVIFVIFIFLIMLWLNIRRTEDKYGNAYIKDLKISSDLKLSSIEKVYGKPISMQSCGDMFYDIDYGSFIARVEKSIYIEHNGSDGDARFRALILTDPKLKFSDRKPGIGSTKDYVMKYYKDELTIKDIPEDNEFGYVINSYYIYFTVNDEDIVTRIHISSGL